MHEERSPLHQLLRKLLLGEPSPPEPEELEDDDEAPGAEGLKAKIEDEVGYAKGETKEKRSPGHPE